MSTQIKTFDFARLPIGVEVKDLSFVGELPKLLGNPHKADFYQIIWLTGGEAAFHIDFREVTIRAGEMLLIASGQVCRFDTKSAYSGKAILFTASFFTITELDANFLHTAEILNPVSLNKTVPVCPQLAGSIISLLEEELGRPADDFQLGMAQSCLRILLLETERKLSASHAPVVTGIARNFYNAVELHFRKERNVGFYVDLLGINEKILSKEVKARTGKTPKIYLDSRIMLEAKRLLAYSSLSIKEIGFELGFGEPTNFNKYFRKHTGMAPMQFKYSTNIL